MAKQQLIELVNRLRASGIKVSFTKPKSHYLILLEREQKLSSTAN